MVNALGKLKNGKAPGSSDILPEMLKVRCRNEDFMSLIVNLVEIVWKKKRVPQEWMDAILISIPKKSNLHICYNWPWDFTCGGDGESGGKDDPEQAASAS